MDSFQQLIAQLEQAFCQSSDATITSIAVATNQKHLSKVLLSENSNPRSEPIFLIYSLTKSFIAAATLRLVASKELSLDTPISHWMPLAPQAQHITLKQLLQHTSGLPDYGSLSRYHQAVQRGENPWSPTEFLEYTQAHQLLFEPGTQFAYSNIGYMLLGELLETVRDHSLAEIIHMEILQPLELTQAFFPQTQTDLKHVTLGMSPYLGNENPCLLYHPGWVAHQVIAAPASETAIFYQALLAGQLLPAELLKLMTTPRILPFMPGRPWKEPAYGLGLQMDLAYQPNPLYGHTGGGPGSSACACVFYHNQEAMAVVILANHENVTHVEEIPFRLLKRFPYKLHLWGWRWSFVRFSCYFRA